SFHSRPGRASSLLLSSGKLPRVEDAGELDLELGRPTEEYGQTPPSQVSGQRTADFEAERVDQLGRPQDDDIESPGRSESDREGLSVVLVSLLRSERVVSERGSCGQLRFDFRLGEPQGQGLPAAEAPASEFGSPRGPPKSTDSFVRSEGRGESPHACVVREAPEEVGSGGERHRTRKEILADLCPLDVEPAWCASRSAATG